MLKSGSGILEPDFPVDCQGFRIVDGESRKFRISDSQPGIHPSAGIAKTY
jgi:hypothetical protein